MSDLSMEDKNRILEEFLTSLNLESSFAPELIEESLYGNSEKKSNNPSSNEKGTRNYNPLRMSNLLVTANRHVCGNLLQLKKLSKGPFISSLTQMSESITLAIFILCL